MTPDLVTSQDVRQLQVYHLYMCVDKANCTTSYVCTMLSIVTLYNCVEQLMKQQYTLRVKGKTLR